MLYNGRIKLHHSFIHYALPGSQSGSNVTTGQTDSQTPVQTHSKSGPTLPVASDRVTSDNAVSHVTPGWGKYLADMFPLVKRTELQVCHYMWSAVAQLVECRTRNRESPGSNPRCYGFEVWAFSFTSRRLSRLSCINEYLAIDSGGNVSE